jgi:hypothetical protein
MTTKPNPRRGHSRIQDGGPHGYERKRWAIGRSLRKRGMARKNRSIERDALATGSPLPSWKQKGATTRNPRRGRED